MTGLKPSTTYTYAAYAGNAFATSYTSPTTFKTAAPPNLPPTANAGGPYTIDEGGSLTLGGSGTDPGTARRVGLTATTFEDVSAPPRR